jgi:hypothetical protein
MKPFVSIAAIAFFIIAISMAPVKKEKTAVSPVYPSQLTITYDSLVKKAFALSRQKFVPVTIPQCSNLDPPADGNLQSPGMVYQECLSVSSVNLADRDLFYASAKPRCGANRYSFDIYLGDSSGKLFEQKTWADCKFVWESPLIQPPLNPDNLPPECKTLTEFLVGHKQTSDNWPQFFDFIASGYVRFCGYSPQIFGSSYRVATHAVFDEKEDFPTFKELYFSIKTSSMATTMALIESELFEGAVNFDLSVGYESQMDVTATLSTRRKLTIKQEPYTGLVAYSSMFWKNESATLSDTTDEAHDCDIAVIGFDTDNDGKINRIAEYKINNPAKANGLNVVTFDSLKYGKQIFFAIENRDRNPDHYKKYNDAQYANRSSYSIQLLQSSVPLSVQILESPTESEYNDNIVMNLAISQDIETANKPEDCITVKYITRAYFPIDSDSDGLTNQMERLIGTDSSRIDTDNDLITDYIEMKNGTDPLIKSAVKDYNYNDPSSVKIVLDCFPNPCQDETTLSFYLLKSEYVLLEIYNPVGKKIETLLETRLTSGSHKVKWHCGIYPAGIYLCKLVAENKVSERILIRTK